MNEQQAFRAIRNTIRLEHLSDDLANTVGPELREVFRELGEQFKAMPPGNIEREIWYRQARQRVASVFVPLNNEMRDELMQRLDSEVVDQMKFAESYLNDAAGDAAERAAVVAPQSGVSVLENTSKVQFTRQQLHTIAESTTVLGDRLGDLFRPSLDKGGKWGKWIEQNIGLIDRKVKTGFLTGMTSDQIAATLPGLGREAVRRNKAIARTAVMDMSARSQEALWQANSDVIKGWEFDATMDNRVCDQCAPWDGEFKQTRGQLPATPLHINCRCRALPLSASEMLLRKEDGPQRRSVVELIDAPSKEAAIAKAKLKPGVKAARAYASQVKGPDGRKYWRVAEDIVKSDKPLTMAEFLKQASPATQQQVLGSEKRRGEFLKLIRGTGGRPPISPDRALKEVTEWRPTVTRRPRLSAQMKLDISKLKSQKELMKQNSEGEQHIVYGYLRGKDSGSGKAGSPYYVGIGNSYTRAYREHRRGGRRSTAHNVPVPKNEALVRQFGTFSTRAAAAKREQELIARYGRKGVDEKGILLNRSIGGESSSLGVKRSEATKRRVGASSRGRRWSAEQKARLAEQQKGRLRTGRTTAMAQRLGVDPALYSNATPAERRLIRERIASGVSPADAVKNLNRAGKGPGYARRADSAARYGLEAKDLEGISNAQLQLVRKRFDQGVRGKAQLLAPPQGKGALAPATEQHLINKYQIPLDEWRQLTKRQKQALAARYSRGDRGEDLWGGLKEGIRQNTWQQAKEMGLDPVFYANLPQDQRGSVRSKFKHSKGRKRGAALLEGL